MFVPIPIQVRHVPPVVLYDAASTNLQVPCATQVFPEGIVDVDAIDGNDPLLIVALNVAPEGAGGLTVPVILDSLCPVLIDV
jgi:hypothetical protein